MEGSASELAATDVLECPGHVNFDDDSMLRLKQEELDRLRGSFDRYVATSAEVEAELQLALEISEGKLHAATRLQQQLREQVEDLQRRVLVAERLAQEERDRRQDTAALDEALGTGRAALGRTHGSRSAERGAAETGRGARGRGAGADGPPRG